MLSCLVTQRSDYKTISYLSTELRAGGVAGALAPGVLRGDLLAVHGERVLDLTGQTTLPELVEWLRACAVLVTNDSGPMHIAAAAGIRVFATGGIGGVHRGAAESMDVSADLEELARTNIAVVCAGIKSVLDIGRTLEYLETVGVPMVGFRTDTVPAFYARSSGFPVDYRVDDPAQLEAVAGAIDERFKNEPEPTYTQPEKAFFAQAAKELIHFIEFTRWIGYGAVFAVLGLIANAVTLIIRGRVKENAILQTLGYAEVATADNGLEALDKVKEVRPDVIFMDLQMPEMGGVEAAEKIRSNRRQIKLAANIAASEHEPDEEDE